MKLMARELKIDAQKLFDRNRSFNWTQWNFMSEYIENHDSEWSEKEFLYVNTGSKELKERIILLKEAVNVIES